MDDAIRMAGPDDLDDVVRVLRDAFTTDPLMAWAFPDAGARPRRLAALWRFMGGEGYLPFGDSTVVPGGDGAALWLRPGHDLSDEFWEARGGELVERLEGDVKRLSSLSELMAAHHPHDREHWYLLAIGVAPAAQGRRLGHALLAHTLTRADADGAPAYLEATSPRSRRLYERFGFEVLAEFTAGDDGPPLWPMWREPAGGRDLDAS